MKVVLYLAIVQPTYIKYGSQFVLVLCVVTIYPSPPIG